MTRKESLARAQRRSKLRLWLTIRQGELLNREEWRSAPNRAARKLEHLKPKPEVKS